MAMYVEWLKDYLAAVLIIVAHYEELILMNNWIAINKQMPKEHQRVLVINKQGYVRLTSQYQGKFECPEIITHWMPLPKFKGD